jgi:CPA2 family monovalent cation:H+ antiporter-2
LDRWLGRWVRARPPVFATPALELNGEGGHVEKEKIRAVVIGYGPVGQTLTRLLQENAIEPTIVEMNLDTVRRLRAMGMTAIYGDANHRQTLEEAQIAQARGLLLSASGLTEAKEIVRTARALNPSIRVLARSAYLRERTELRLIGADEVYAGEGEVALAMAESLLRRFGATPDQIDRERERVRADLFGEEREQAA